MAIRPEETRSAESLAEHLRFRENLSVSYVAIDQDPPDFRFTVSGTSRPSEEWAVEVTGLAQYVELEGEARERRLVEVGLHRRIELLDKKHSAALPHGYGLFVDVPIDKRVLRTLEKRVLEYAQSGETEMRALDHDEAVASVLRDLGESADANDPNVQFALAQLVPSRVRVRIKGFPGQKGILLMSGPSGTDRLPRSENRVADIAANIEYSVRRIYDAKLHKMKALCGYRRKVLLLWCDYILATPEEISAALAQQYPVEGDLDGIFFIEYDWKAVSLAANFKNLL